MSLPLGFRYLNNMALYLFKNLGFAYTRDYGEDLECKYDRADKTLYKERVFCLDCPDFEACKGKWWRGCPTRAMALKIMREK